MVAYSFQKRFVGQVQAGLEPGPWVPGMKRHTLRQPRVRGHVRPEQPIHLYTGMRTRHCRMIGKGVARVQIPVTLLALDDDMPLVIQRRGGAAPRSYVRELAPVVRDLLDLAPGRGLVGGRMEEFVRADGFRDLADMLAYFEVPVEKRPCSMDMVLIGWAPGEPV